MLVWLFGVDPGGDLGVCRLTFMLSNDMKCVTCYFHWWEFIFIIGALYFSITVQTVIFFPPSKSADSVFMIVFRCGMDHKKGFKYIFLQKVCPFDISSALKFKCSEYEFLESEKENLATSCSLFLYILYV